MGGVGRVGRGRGCEAGGGGGARQRLPSRDWSPAPPRSAPCARVGAARRKRKRASPVCSGGHQGAPLAALPSPGSLAWALPRSPGSPECVSPGSPGSPACAPPRSPGSLAYAPLRSHGTPGCESTDHLTVPVLHSAGTWDCSAPLLRAAAQPTSPSPGSPREEGGAVGVAARAAGTCPLPFTSGCPWAGAEAAAAERALPVPPHAAPRQWVRGSVVGPRVAWPLPQGSACQARRRPGKHALHSRPLRPHHGWHKATVCILHLGASLMQVMRVHGCGCHIPRTCKNMGVHTGPWMRPLLFQGGLPSFCG